MRENDDRDTFLLMIFCALIFLAAIVQIQGCTIAQELHQFRLRPF
jgi:hypothetical protein